MPESAGPAKARAAALRAAVDRLRHRAAHAVFTPVPTADGTAERLIAALRESGWRVSTKIQSHNSWAEIPAGGFAEWWAARPGQLRSTVARKGRKGAVAIRIATRFDLADWQAYSDVYAASWKEAEGHPEFLRALAQAAGARGALRLGLASIDGAVVAAQFWTIEAGVASIHKLAQLRGPQIDACSPGTLLTHALYRHAAEQDGVTRIDFGTGSDSFKQGWTDAGTALMTIEAFDFSQPRAWPMLARLGARRLAGRVLRR